MKSLRLAGIAMLVVAGTVGAQTGGKPDMEVITVDLRHLTPAEAVKLLSPYVKAGGGGVFSASDNLSIVTLRDVPDGIARMRDVLAKYDRQPASIRLVFQLIEADPDSKTPSTAGGTVAVELDSTLRSVLKFASYRVLSQGVTSAGELSSTLMKLAGAVGQTPYSLSTRIDAIRLADPAGQPVSVRSPSPTGASGTVRLQVWLYKDLGSVTTPNGLVTQHDNYIETSLDVPFGHTVVLGTAALGAPGKALILTVRPELLSAKP